MATAGVGIGPDTYAGAMAGNGLTALLFGRIYDRFGLNALVIGIFISMLALPFGFLGGAAGMVISVACWATGLGAHVIRDRSGELRGLRGQCQGGRCDCNSDSLFHWILPFFFSISSQS